MMVMKEGIEGEMERNYEGGKVEGKMRIGKGREEGDREN